MINQTNPFDFDSGSNRLGNPGYIALILGIAAIAALLISRMGMIGGLALILLPFIAIYLNILFRHPIIGLYSAIVLGFVLLGLGKYITGITLGVVMDGILIITYIALIFNKFTDKIDWSPALKDITLLSVIWFGYSVFELVNPEARSSAAWFSGRGIGLYMMLIVPLTLIFIDSDKKLNFFFYLWGVLSILASLKVLMQHFW